MDSGSERIIWLGTTTHLSYNPDLALSDYHFFLHLKKNLSGQRYNDEDDVKTPMMQCLVQQVANFYDDGVQKLVVRNDK